MKARSATRTVRTARTIRSRLPVVPRGRIPGPGIEQPPRSRSSRIRPMRCAAHLVAGCPLLRRRHRSCRSVVAPADGLRSAQLQPEPLRPADHERSYRFRLGYGREPAGSPGAEPYGSVADARYGGPRSPCRPGFSINPNAADGKVACTDAAAHFGFGTQAECPETSKIGSLEIDSSALPGPMPGFVYLGQPLPGNKYRIFLVADGFATAHQDRRGRSPRIPPTGQLIVDLQGSAPVAR